jgi:hypothetical protein
MRLQLALSSVERPMEVRPGTESLHSYGVRPAIRSSAIHSWPSCQESRSRGSPRPAASSSQASHQRLRAEFFAGAEVEWHKRTGRPMTAEELGRVLRRYPGDI